MIRVRILIPLIPFMPRFASGLRLFLGTLFLIPAMGSAYGSASSLIELLSKPQLSDNDRSDLYLMGQDDPTTFMKDLLALWNSAPNEQGILLKARAGWLLAQFWSEDVKTDSHRDIKDILKETKALTEAHHLPISLYEIQFLEMQGDLDGSGAAFENAKNTIESVVKQIENDKMKANALSILVQFYARKGTNSEDIPRMLNEVQRLLGDQKHPTSGLDVETLNNMSVAFSILKQSTAIKSVDEPLNDFCARHQVRFFCGVRAYNLGRWFTSQPEKDSLAKAETYLFRALEYSKSLQNDMILATTSNGLAMVYIKSGDFQKAISYGEKAEALFEKMNLPIWLAETLINVSIAYFSTHQYKIALEKGLKSLAVSPPEYKSVRMKLYQHLAEVYKSQGQFAEAFQYLGLYVELEKEINSEDMNKKYIEMRNSALTQQNEMQADQIQLLNKFRIVSLFAVSLALLVGVILVLVWRQARIIRKSRKTMKEVLDHIDEGIAILDRDLKIKSSYSPYLDTIFGKENIALHDGRLLDVLFPSDSDVKGMGEMVGDTLKTCLGEQALTWDLNNSHLPLEVPYLNSILALNWQPLFNSSQQISSYLISIRDISRLRAIEKKMAEESERVKTMQQRLEEVLAGNAAHMRDLLRVWNEKSAEVVQQIFDDKQRHLALRCFHTWKGAARTLGLRLLASRIHEMESALVDSSPLQAKEIEGKWQALQLAFQDYEHILNTILVNKKSDQTSVLDLYDYAKIYTQDVADRLEEHHGMFLGVTILDRVEHWKDGVLSHMHEMLLHALSNAVDHGFIRPLQKQKSTNPALIQIRAVPRGSSVDVSVIDNGVGIDWDGLRKKAEAVHFQLKPGQSLAELLFQDGVSTADVSSETSGRGVGLSAVRALCSALQGEISLQDAPNGGAVLHMKFPAASVLDIQALPKAN